MTTTKKNAKNLLKISIPLAAMLAATAGGCKSYKQHMARPEGMQSGDKMMGKDEVSDVTRIMNTQIANGSRTDATLRAYHFSRGNLNSLGRDKLDSMIEGGEDAKAELVVFLDLPTTDVEKALTDARHDAVTHYLMGRGLAEDSFRLESGYNPNAMIMAASVRASQSAEAAEGSESSESADGGAQSFAPSATGSK